MRSSYVLIIAIIALTNVCSGKKDQHSAHRLKKDYEKINRYLEKNGASNDPILNMEKVEALLDEKSGRCSLFGGSSMVDTLNLLIQLSSMKSNGNVCLGRDFSLLENLDFGLEDESSIKTRDRPLTRVHKLIEHYALERAKACALNPSIDLKNSFKQSHYDYINRFLVENLPENRDIEANMNKAEELLNGLKFREGSLGQAVQQFLRLREIISEETCGKKGYEILLKNDLATRGGARTTGEDPLRRVDVVVHHYAKKHAELCRPVIRRLFNQELQNLPEETYLRVFEITSAHYFGPDRRDKLIEMLNSKEVRERITTASIVESIKEFVRMREEKEYLFLSTAPIIKLDRLMLTPFLKAVSASDPESNSLKMSIDEISGRKYVDEEKIEKFADRYLFNPCKQYLEFFKDLKDADDYGTYVANDHLALEQGRILKDLPYYIARAAYNVCDFVNKERRYITSNIKLE